MTESKGPEDKEKKYRVHWVSEETEFQSHGEPLSKEQAEAAAEYANRKYPDIRHSAVPVDDDDKPLEENPPDIGK